MRNVLIASLLAVSVSAWAQLQEPILGVKLGQPLKGQFSQCAGRRDNWCFVTPTTDKWIKLNPPDLDSPTGLPTWMKRDYLTLEPNPDGIVDQFYVETLGPSVQDRVIESVKGRFGDPKQLERTEKQTTGGAKVETAYAVWETQDAAVTHVCIRINSCVLSFYTADAYKRHKERMQQQLQRNKL
jgi:hypothetical protein